MLKLKPARAEDGETPLRLAAWQGHLEMAALLLEHNNANVNTYTTRRGEGIDRKSVV